MYQLRVVVPSSKWSLLTKKSKAIDVISTVKYHTKAVLNLLLGEQWKFHGNRHPGP